MLVSLAAFLPLRTWTRRALWTRGSVVVRCEYITGTPRNSPQAAATTPPHTHSHPLPSAVNSCRGRNYMLSSKINRSVEICGDGNGLIVSPQPPRPRSNCSAKALLSLSCRYTKQNGRVAKTHRIWGRENNAPGPHRTNEPNEVVGRRPSTPRAPSLLEPQEWIRISRSLAPAAGRGAEAEACGTAAHGVVRHSGAQNARRTLQRT